MHRLRKTLLLIIGGLAFQAAIVRAGESLIDACGCVCQREEVFDFTKQPVFRRMGQDRYEIEFGARGRCDVSVGIVNGEGMVIRHLACGCWAPMRRSR